jgi:hypothetical protein
MNRPLMTIGDLARRTGVAEKVVRRQQDMGLIYTRGRSPARYHIFDEKAFRCAKSAAHQRYSPPVSQTAGAERGDRPLIHLIKTELFRVDNSGYPWPSIQLGEWALHSTLRVDAKRTIRSGRCPTLAATIEIRGGIDMALTVTVDRASRPDRVKRRARASTVARPVTVLCA